MELVNELYGIKIKGAQLSEAERVIIRETIENIIKLLSPIAPHFCEELWSEIGGKQSLYFERWPLFDTNLIREEEMLIVIQVDGKLRDKIKMSADISEEIVKNTIVELPKIKKWIEHKKIDKIIYIPGKLINIVLH